MTAVVLMAKAPRAGTVKTRLAAAVGNDCAVALYRRIGRKVAEEAAQVAPLTVWFTPADAEEEVRDWLGDPACRPQGAGDLGDRMREAFSVHFARGDTPVILIGADCPGVTGAVLREAEACLSRADVVLGPSLDGGYYLVGLNRPEPRLFADMPWSTAGVLEITESRCREHDLVVERLSPRRDLDTVEDLRALDLECP